MHGSAVGGGAPSPKAAAIVFAGGAGERMNTLSTPKQFLQIHGQSILEHTLRHFLYHPRVGTIVVVCLQSWMDVARAQLTRHIADERVVLVPGGRTTQESVYHGLDALRGTVGADVPVLVHDAVRPLIAGALIDAVIDSVVSHGNGVTVSAQNETVVTMGEDDLIDGVLDRSRTRAAKAPQGFTFGSLMEAHDWAVTEGRNDFIDSASLMRARGHRLHPVEGPMENIKVTTPTDFYILRAVLDAHEAQQVFGFQVADPREARRP